MKLKRSIAVCIVLLISFSASHTWWDGTGILGNALTNDALSTWVYVDPLFNTFFEEYNATVAISIANVSDLCRFAFSLLYNTTCLDTTEVKLGNVFDQSNSTTTIGINETAGIISFNAALLPSAEPFSGNGTLSYITFLGRQAGSSILSLNNTALNDSGSVPISHKASHGRAEIERIFASREVLIQFRPEATAETIQEICNTYGLIIIDNLPFLRVRRLQIVSSSTVKEMVELLTYDSNIELVEPNFISEADMHLISPSDPQFPLQWGLNNYGQRILGRQGVIDADIDATQAWEHETVADRIVAILDTGADLDHPDLNLNLWTNTAEAVGDSNGDGSPGQAGVDDDNDRWGHDRVQGTADDEAEANTLNGIDDDHDGLVDETGIDLRDEEVMLADYDRDGQRLAGVDMRVGTGDDDVQDLALAAQDDDESGFIDDIHGADFVNHDGDPRDDYGHGTHVAGIVGAVGDNGVGVCGVMWRVRLMIVKVLGADGSGSIAGIARGIRYAIEHGACVINLSLGRGRQPGNDGHYGTPDDIPATPDVAEQNAIANANNAGVLIVAAAGNQGLNVTVAGNEHYPACYPNPNIISVGASDNRDNLAIWHGPSFILDVTPPRIVTRILLPIRGSNFGTDSVDLTAPGHFIYSTMPRASPPNPMGGTMLGEPNWDRWQDTNGDGGVQWNDLDGDFTLEVGEFDENPPLFAADYDYMSGTSMAAPFVSGAIVHFWTLFPLPHLAVKQWILQRVDSRPYLRDAVLSGINHDGRLRMISGDDFGDAPDPLLVPNFYPTKRRYWGASHEDIGEEWLGYCSTSDRTPEFDADAISEWDGDRVGNICPCRVPPNPEPPYIPGQTPDLEVHDDGIWIIRTLPGFIFLAYSIRTAHEDIVDFEGGRYLPGQATVLAPDKRLYINIWIDWNQDGDWDDGELVFNRAHNPTLEWNRTHCSKWRFVIIPVPPNARAGKTWLRARLDYGENVMPAKYDSDPSVLNTYGLAQFGEVEDYKVTVTPACPQPPPEYWPLPGYDLSHSRYYPGPGPCSNNTLWTYKTTGIVGSSPAIAEGKVFLGSVDGRVYAIDAETGALVWNYTTGDRVDSSPAVVDGRVFVGSWDGNLYALNASTGGLLWKYATGDAVVSSPTVANVTVFVGSSDRNLYALNAVTGNLVWKYTAEDWVDSSPAIADGKVFFGCWDGFVYALNASTGNQVWKYGTGDVVVSSPAVVEGKVYIGSMNGKIYCLDAQTGSYKWGFTTAGPIKGSAAVTCGKVFIGSYDGNVYALNATTGGLIWKLEVGYPFYSSPVVACKQKVYVASLSEEPSQPPAYSFTDAVKDLVYIYTGNPVPVTLQNQLPYLDVVEAKAELTEQTVEFSITVNGGIPPLNHTTFWTVMMDRNDYAGDNSESYPTQDVDTMYSIICDSTTETWKIERATYESWGWDVTPTGANWSMISAYPDGRVIMHISVPLGELGEYLPPRIPWKVKTETDPTSIGDLAPDQGLAYLSLLHARIYSLDVETGGTLWTYETESQIYSSPAIANSTVFVGSFDGTLYAFRSIHDVSIADAAPCKTVIGEGYTAKVNATVNNEGDFSETFDILFTANSTVVQTVSVTVDKGSSVSITLILNTTDFVKGNYTINVHACPVLGETDGNDNTCDGGCIIVTFPGDIKADEVVDIYDAITLANAFNSKPGGLNWNPNADINSDDFVDIYDAIILAGNYGKKA